MNATITIPGKTWCKILGTDVEILCEEGASLEVTPLEDQMSGRRAVQVEIDGIVLRIPAAS